MAHSPVKNRRLHLIMPMALSMLCLIAASAAEPAMDLLQPQGLNHTGLYQLRQLDPNLTGAGVRFAVICRSITYLDGEPQNDYRPALDHDCFKYADFAFHDEQFLPAGVSPHSTAVCSILFGRDPNAYNEQLGSFYYQGAAPQARADVYEFWHFVINNVFTGAAPDDNILTADVGYQFEDWWTRGIESLAARHGLTVIIGIGNGANASDPVLYPGAGANVIGVGVVSSINASDLATGLSHFALAYPQYSSAGPTSDGRCKPDIVAPGNCLAARPPEPNLYLPTGNWSSFATPVVAGTAALLLQKAAQDPNLSLAGSAEGGNCVIKALLLNSAAKLPYWHKGRLTKDDDHDVPLDYLQGAGIVDAVGAYNQLIAGRRLPGDCPLAGWDLNTLNRDDAPANVYRISIPAPAGKVISATTAWNRHLADNYPFQPLPQRDADLRLEVWAIDPNDSNKDYLLDYSDSRVDTIEHVSLLADPNITDYEIVVLLSDEHDVNQPAVTPPYALAWNVAPAPPRNDLLWFDLNADGSVDNLDTKVFLDNMLASIEHPDRCLFGDINDDGVLDANDLDILLTYISTRSDGNGNDALPPNPEDVLPLGTPVAEE